MSWTSKKTGRPKEEGGHRRVDITVDERTFSILSVPDNRSKYIEHCVNACTETKWIAFQESSVTVNDNYRTFKTAATFVWIPNDSMYNGIISTFCTFEHQCTCKTFEFRMKINESVASSVEVHGNTTWSFSQVYTESSFDGGRNVRANQDIYVIEFQFEPYRASDQAYVKDVTMFLEVMDGMPNIHTFLNTRAHTP